MPRRIQQIYCTHCTYGSSAIERRQGELAARTLGYGARAGSLENEHLRECYRQIERYVYYYLPRDASGEQKLVLTADTAPRRLFFAPANGGNPFGGQVCYRQTDSEGRPGSYFAHVLIFEPGGDSAAAPGLELLQTWRAPGWTREDSPRIAHRLPALSAPSDLNNGTRPAIDDAVLLSFLTTAANGTFDDPARVIPDRWRRADVSARRTLLVEALDAAFEIGLGERDGLLAVVEPDLAALLFYGVLRLIPRGAFADRLGYSTFEPNPERPNAAMAATTFLDPQAADLPAELYRSRNVVINTFNQRRSDRRRPLALYPQYVTARLVEHGWPTVDWMLANMEACGAREVLELERLAAADRLLPVLFGAKPTADSQWRAWPLAGEYLGRVVVQDLSNLKPDDPRLRTLVGTSAHLLILELAGDSDFPGARPALDFLLKNLPIDWVGQAVAFGRVLTSDKADLLARHIIARGALPAGCEKLWEEFAAAPGGSAEAPLLVHVLARLDAAPLERFTRSVWRQQGPSLLSALTEVCRRWQPNWAPLTTAINLLDDSAVIGLYRQCGPSFFLNYPETESAIRAKLGAMVRSLAAHPDEFNARVETVRAGQRLLDSVDRQRLEAWDRCCAAMHDAWQLARESRTTQPALIENAFRRMAEAAAEAIPLDAFPADPQGVERIAALRQIGTQVMGGEPLLPPGDGDSLWRMVAWRFVRGKWPAAAPPVERVVPAQAAAPLAEAENLGTPRWAIFAWIFLGLAFAALAFVVVQNRDRIRAAIWNVEPAVRKSGKSAAAPKTAPGKRPVDGEPTDQPAPKPIAKPKPAEEPNVERPNIVKPEMNPPEAEPKPEVKPEPEPKPDSPKQPTPEQLIEQQMAAARAAAEEQQRREAERRTEWQKFAKENGGVFEEGIPLDQGIASLPEELIDTPGNLPELYLGAGRVVFKNRENKWQEFAFGEKFREQPADAKGQEVPELAEAVGFESVSVHVAVDPKEKKPKLMLRAAPKSAAEVGVDKKDVQRLQKQINSLGALLRKRPPANSEARPKWEEEVMSYCGIALPEYPPEVNRNDPRFRDDPQGLRDAIFARERARDDVEAKRHRIRSDLEKTAEAKRKEWGSQITKLETDARNQKNQRRDAEQKALSDFYSRCAKITALVYRRGAVKNPAGAATPDAEVFAGAAVEGQTHESEKFVPFDDFVAQVRPDILDPTGRRLPPAGDPTTPGRIQCQVIEKREDGQESIREVAGRSEFDAYRIRAGAKAVSLRFRFWSSAGPVAGAAGRVVAESKWLRIEPIESEKQYRLSFRLTDEEMAKWRLLSAGAPARKGTEF